jgi:hypothetical protein
MQQGLCSTGGKDQVGEREKFEFQREQEEERILSLDLRNMTYTQQEYYEGRQHEILEKRRARLL